uniref:Uncharacterized protein n=1 Tax=Knipowitschia caucasica TaxID=637954 RepID=A0AAV2IUH1_KNICA
MSRDTKTKLVLPSTRTPSGEGHWPVGPSQEGTAVFAIECMATLRPSVYAAVCLSAAVVGGKGNSSDKPPHLGRFKKTERSCGEAFISETAKKGQNQDGGSAREDGKAGEA